MGASTDDFVKYPKTMHLHGSKVANEDKMLTEKETTDLLKKNNVNFIWESKLDGTNVGLSFDKNDNIIIQNRGRILGQGEHPQYQILMSWAYTFIEQLRIALGQKYIMFGEFCYAVHTIRYKSLPHYFNEFDIFDKERSIFLSTPLRRELLSLLVSSKIIAQVPIVYPRPDAKNWLESSGKLTLAEARRLAYEYGPIYGEDKPEGLYLKVEQGNEVVGRYKLVRDEFIQKIIDDNIHWKSKPVEVQGLADGVNIFSP